MSAYIAVLTLCSFPGILSSIIQIFLLKKSEKEFHIVGIVSCYMCLFYGILSSIKLLLDDGSSTLIECFRDTVPMTYLHYLIPLGLLAAVTPPLITFFLRRMDLPRLIALFDSCMFGFLAMTFVIANRIGNLCYVVIMLISILAASGIAFFCPGDLSFCSAADLKRRIGYAIPATLFYVVTVILSLPGTLFLNNRSEIDILPSSFARALLAGAAVYFIILTAGGILLLTWRQLKLFYTLLFAITFAGYLQNMFLNGRLLAMDGGRQEWHGFMLWGNTAIWILLVAGLLLLKRFLHKGTAKIYRLICVYLSLVQAVSLGYLAVSSFMKNENTSAPDVAYMLSTEGALELHPENNVLVFILDWYDGQIMQKMLEKDPGFLTPLDGFTDYTNAASMYAFTEMSLPYLLSGVEWQFNMDKTEYIDYAYENGHMLEDITNAGYEIGLYTKTEYINDAISDKLCNYTQYKPFCQIWDTMQLMLKCSKYQMAPFLCKDMYWYTTDSFSSLSYDGGFTKWATYDDLPFKTALDESGLQIDKKSDSAGVFKLYHMYGAHPPYRMTENFLYTEDRMDYISMMSQAEGCMKIIYEYVSQLKALGLYDGATIIITADHGENYLFDPSRVGGLKNLQLQNTTNPILFVKPAGQSGDKLCENSAPVSHAELVASIMETINPQASASYGRTLAEVSKTEDRVRTFIFTRGDLPYVRAEIHGDVLDPKSWTVMEEIKPEDK